MAKNIAAEANQPSSDSVSAKHNVANINQAIVDGLNKIHKLDNDIDDAKEKHVAPIQELRKKAMRTLKADTGISIKALEAHYKVLKVYRDAEQFVKEDEADQLRDDLKVVFDALHQGGQLDWVNVAAPEDDKPKANGAKKTGKAAAASEGSAATH